VKGATATEGAKAAGYSERSARFQGSKLGTNRNIRARIEELKQQTAQQATVSARISKAWVISRLKENAERAMQAVISHANFSFAAGGHSIARPPPWVSLLFAFTASSMPSLLSIMTTLTPKG
jgi:terminase small subunit-like protein